MVAKDYPDMNFLIYHSGYIIGEPERGYDPERGEGIDALVQSLLDNEVAPNGKAALGRPPESVLEIL